MSNIERIQNRLKKLHELPGEPSLPIPKELQAYEWALFAIEFLAAASILDQKYPHFQGPKLQLTGHGIECSMKACIATVSAKIPITHDLVKLYKVIENHGFHLDDRLLAMLVLLNHAYYQDLGSGTKFKLRYPAEMTEGSGVSIPYHSDMEIISDSLIEQAASRAPDIHKEMFKTIPTHRANLRKLV